VHPTQRNKNGFHQFGQRRISRRIVHVGIATVAGFARQHKLIKELKMSYQTRYELIETIYKHAIASLVVAVAGRKVPREPYSRPIKGAAKANKIKRDLNERKEKNQKRMELERSLERFVLH
jgi:hypothetical protein